MTLALAKLLPLVVFPVGLTILAGLAALGFSFLGFLRTSRALMAAAIAVLWLASTPLFADWLYARLEAENPPVAIESLPEADVAIVLGGTMGRALPPRLAPDASASVDRVLHAARLFRAGEVAAILVSGGNLPWLPADEPEAALVAGLLVELGVPREAIVLESQSRTTRENAVNGTAVMTARAWRTALLVTSAAHMPRALAAFRKAGAEATPATTDVAVTYPLYESALDLLPGRRCAGAYDRRDKGASRDACLSSAGMGLSRARPKGCRSVGLAGAGGCRRRGSGQS